MIHRKKANIEWLEFELLQPFPQVVHGVFLRHGGVSDGEHRSLNFCLDQGDSKEAVIENKRRAAEALSLPFFVTPHQCHGDVVIQVPQFFYRLDCGSDGIITDRVGIPLLVRHADCQAAIFFDPVRQVIGNIHCGWRGNIQNIYGKTVEKLKELFGTDPRDLRVCISPSLGPGKGEFIHHLKEFPPPFLRFQTEPNHFDLWAISKMQLESAGVLEAHIEIAHMCTFEQKDDFFSYRREKKTGRHGTVVALKDPELVSRE